MTQLSLSRLGAQQLAAIARERKSGRVTWTVQAKSYGLEFANGRPVRAVGASGQATDDRAAVVRTLRAFAMADTGTLELVAGAVSGDASIDTLGELLVELARGLTAAHINAIATSGVSLIATADFDRLSGPIAQAAGSAPQRAMSADRATIIAYILGALAPKPSALLEEIGQAHAAMATQDHYAFLGIDKGATADIIRKAYFEHAKRWHTDRFAGVELGEHREMAEALFRRADEAQRVLSDAEQRGDYDVMLERTARGLPTDVNVMLEAEGLFRKAQIFVRRGQAAAAEPLLAQAIAMNKGEAEFYAYYGYAIFAARGVPAIADARAQIKKALDMNEKLDVAHEFLGKMARVEGNLELATTHLKKALGLNTKNHEAERELRFVQTRQEKERGDKAGLLGKLLKK